MFNFINKSKPGTKLHFPTALGLLILLVGIGVGIFLIKTRSSGNEAGADQNSTPNQVKITNITDSSLTVSWITAKPVTGTVKFGAEINNIKQKAMDDRDQLSGEAGLFEVHHVTLKNLNQKTKYYFKIESGGKQFDNQGKPFEASTGQMLGSVPAADPIYGVILTPSGAGAENTIVYVNLANGSALSALSKTNGNWALSLATARSADLNNYLTYDMQATIINILVQGGKQGSASATTITANDNPVPEITLGKSHDFRDAANNGDEATMSALANKPSTAESAFEAAINVATTSPAASNSGEVTLDNPSYNGEIINATQPAFIGSGPPGKVLAIKVNSENTYTGSAVVDEDGNWEFTPPSGLEPGTHSVTISYIDSAGEEKSLTRSFIIAAAGDTEIPAIIATPSGSTATDSSRTSMPSTASGVPHPGTGETTLIVVTAGIGLVIGGFKLKKSV